MKKVIDIFAKAELPAVLCVASDGGATGEITFTKHTDATTEGKSVVIISNVDELKSPITGEPVGSVGETASAENQIKMDAAKVLASMVCVASCAGCSHDTYVTPEVASELDTHTIHCASCGDEVEAVYTDDLLATAADDDADVEDDDSEDVTDALDEDVDEDDDAVEGDDSDTTTDGDDADGEETTTDADATDDDTSTDEDDADSAEETDDGDSADETDETDTEEDDDDGAADESSADAAPVVENKDEVVEQPTRALPAIVVASYEGQRIRLASLTDTARYEAFLGDTHIGSLFKDECSEGVKAQFGKLDVVTSAFASTFWKSQPEIASGKVESLKDFGFKPAIVAIAVDQMVEQQIGEAQQAAETKSAEAIQQSVDAVVASFQVAAAGINKGMLNGTNLYTEVAKLLSMYGVQSAEEAASRFVEKFSTSYLSGIVTAAAELRAHEPKYVEGLAKAYETAAYKTVPVNGDVDLTLTTSSLVPHKPAKPAPTKITPAPVVDESSAKPLAHIRNAFSRFR